MSDAAVGTSPTTHQQAKTRSLNKQEQNNKHYKNTKTNYQTTETSVLQLKRETS
jgi:hypothetical protein